MSQVSPNLMQLMQGGTGNPLLDMYASQYGGYAALAAAPAAAAASPAAAVSQTGVMPAVSQSISLDASQAQANAAAVAGKLRKLKLFF